MSKDFRAESDVHTLRQAQEIMNDAKRLKAAQNMAAKQKKDLEKITTLRK